MAAAGVTAATRANRSEVGRLAVRVAVRATILVAIAYLIVAGAVAAFATGSLTAQVDHELADTLDHFRGQPIQQGPGPVGPPPEDRALGPQRALWLIGDDGSIRTDRPELTLPPDQHHATAPTTVVISGEDIRISGMDVNGGHLVIGESLAPVNAARTTVIYGEILIAPVLLLVVFVGAVLIGRRVAMPIERARRRQLDFTADASHELRTPLSVIEANASLALAPDASGTRDAEWYRRGFVRVDAEANRMRRLLEDMLWLARFDAAETRPASEPVDLATLAHQTADRFAAVAEARSLTLEVDATGDALHVAAPPEWLDRLIGVLLDNACKYSPAGGAVKLTVTEAAGRVTLAVEDAGPGIPEPERERIFDRFHRATGKETGAGLGLAIADAVVSATGGKWSVGTSAAGGARMSVVWPRAGAGGSGREVVPDILGSPRRSAAEQE